MHEAGQHLVGKHDFTSFRGSGCQANTPIRNIIAIEVNRSSGIINIDIKANAFLYHMVRNIVGVLIKIGSGDHPPVWIKEVLKARDRTKAATTADAHGLYLVSIEYGCNFE